MSRPKLSILIPTLILLLIVAAGGLFLSTRQTDSDVKGTQVQQQTQKANLVINDNIYELEFNPGETFFSALESLETTNDNFTFEYTQYNFGVMINSINGITPNQDEFWKLLINNQDASVGVSDYQLRPQDKIEFKIEKINF